MPLSDFERRLCRAIEQRRNDLLRDLARHVAIPTGRNFAAGLNEYREIVLDRLRALGAQVQYLAGESRPAWLDLPGESRSSAGEAIPPVAIARKLSSSGKSRVLIAGHLDTVHDPQGEFRELSIASDRRTAVGPGAVDMKGGIVIALAALEALHECGVNVDFTFLLNSDEETGSFHSFQALRSAALEHEVGLVLEPALPDGSLAVQRMGAGQFKIEAFGRAAHVGRDFAQGVSAVNALARAIVRVSELAQPDKELIVNVGPLVGGAVTNIVPEYAACWGNVRFADAHGARALGEAFDRLRQNALPRIEVRRAFNRPAKPLTPAVQQLADAARSAAEDLDQRLPFGATGGVCDGNILQDAGLPTIDTLGVRGGNLHRTDEFIEIASLVERAQLLAVLINRLSPAPSAHA